MRHGRQAPGRDGERVARLGADPVDEPAERQQTDGVRSLEGGLDVAEILVAPMQLLVEHGLDQREDLPVHVVDGGGEKEQRADDPPVAARCPGRGTSRSGPWVSNGGERSHRDGGKHQRTDACLYIPYLATRSWSRMQFPSARLAGEIFDPAAGLRTTGVCPSRRGRGTLSRRTGSGELPGTRGSGLYARGPAKSDGRCWYK